MQLVGVKLRLELSLTGLDFISSLIVISVIAIITIIANIAIIVVIAIVAVNDIIGYHPHDLVCFY